MKKAYRPAVILLFVTGLAFLACRAVMSPGAPGPRSTVFRGALETIHLSEFSHEAGLVAFPHYRHHRDTTKSGSGIGCAVCHHHYAEGNKETLLPCRTCHLPHDEAVDMAMETP